MDSPTLDPLALDQLRPFKGQGGGSLLGNLIQTYLDHLPGRVDGLVQAHHAGDATAVFKIAHTLKSASASLGAYTLQGICQRFEDAGRRGHLQETGELLPAFQREVRRVEEALRAEQGRQAP